MVAEVNKEFVTASPPFKVVSIAARGREALRLCKEQKPDLILLDIYLPDIDGITVLHRIRKQQLPIDVIVISAAQDISTIQNAFRLGAVDYIIKPFKYNRFKKALDSYYIMYQTLHKRASVDQETLDRITVGRTPTYEEKKLPKGLQELTLKQVYLFLLNHKGSLSAEEVAAGVGLARVTARRYLEYLKRTGKVSLELQYGSIGRPVNRYYVCDQKE